MATNMASTTASVATTVRALAEQLQRKDWLLATAESCTGGMVAAACTDLAGSSQWFDRGFVTYSNDAKTTMLGVDAALIAQHGAVSQPVAHAMATGALRHSRSQASLAITGIAGPGGGSPDKPVGLVWFAWALGNEVFTEKQLFDGNRANVRATAQQHALQSMLRLIEELPR